MPCKSKPSFHEDKETEDSGLVSAKGKNAQLTRDLKQIILQFTQMRDESRCYFPSQYSVVTWGHKTASISLLWGCPQTHSSTGCLPCWFLRGLGMQPPPLGLRFAPQNLGVQEFLILDCGGLNTNKAWWRHGVFRSDCLGWSKTWQVCARAV